MSQNHKNNESASIGGWVVTIVMLFTIWPVGIIMLISKLYALARSSGVTNAANAWTRRDASANTTSGAENSTRNAENTARGAADTAQTASRPAQPVQTASRPVQPAQAVQAARAAAPSSAAAVKAAKNNAGFNRKLARAHKGARALSVLLTLCAAALAATGGSMLFAAIRQVVSAGFGVRTLFELVLPGIFLAAGVVTFSLRGVRERRVSLYQRYLAVIGTNDVMSVAKIALGSGRSERKVLRDLQIMLDAGYFPSSAYLDNELRAFVSRADAKGNAANDAQAASEPQISVDEYEHILKQLRGLNAEITDTGISYKIERIETVCSKIFSAVREDPAKLPQLRRFMNYYLPTTLKLLRSYRTLERQGIRGENIESAKESIDRVLTSLADGYERQLDQLFRTDVIDIGADINVLENMMARDGLAAASFGGMAALQEKEE